MAAFVTNAEVIHADQPKPVTYDRMNRLVPVADLDLAIAAQVRAHNLLQKLSWLQLLMLSMHVELLLSS